MDRKVAFEIFRLLEAHDCNAWLDFFDIKPSEVLQDLGDLEGARDLIQSAYNSFLEKFGEDHPLTIIIKGNLESIMADL